VAGSKPGTKGKSYCGWLQASRNPFFCFEQALVALCFSPKILAFRSRLMFFCRLNFRATVIFNSSIATISSRLIRAQWVFLISLTALRAAIPGFAPLPAGGGNFMK
jgi:hypothetical protein